MNELSFRPRNRTCLQSGALLSTTPIWYDRVVAESMEKEKHAIDENERWKSMG